MVNGLLLGMYRIFVGMASANGDLMGLNMDFWPTHMLMYGGWASEILHQLIGGKHPTIYRVSTILLVVQDFFHPQYVTGFDQPKLVGGIPTPLKNTKENWDDYSQYMEK